MESLIGRQVGNYTILSRLGSGGMSTVYRAHQTSIGRDVAIKIIRADLSMDRAFVSRFEREAKTAAGLSHMHIVKVFDYGKTDSIIYLVMELLSGGSLNQLIHLQGPLELAQVEQMLSQMAQALDYAHSKGVIHRDLKPENVLLDRDNNCYLSDFGIAKLSNETSALTTPGIVMGTPSYMAPEIWQGELVDARIDVYALGVMLYQVLTGHLPFVADTPYRLMVMHLNEEPVPLQSHNAALPTTINAVLQKAMAKQPQVRYQSAGELSNGFQAALQQGQDGLFANEPVPELLTTLENTRPIQVRFTEPHLATPYQQDTPPSQSLRNLAAFQPLRQPAAASIPRRLNTSQHRLWIILFILFGLLVAGISGIIWSTSPTKSTPTPTEITTAVQRNTQSSTMVVVLVTTTMTPSRSIPPTLDPTATMQCQGVLVSRLIIGQEGQVTQGQPNRVRSEPSITGQVVGRLLGGEIFKVLDGPVCADDMAWWYVKTDTVTGWTAESGGNTYWLEPISNASGEIPISP